MPWRSQQISGDEVCRICLRDVQEFREKGCNDLLSNRERILVGLALLGGDRNVGHQSMVDGEELRRRIHGEAHHSGDGHGMELHATYGEDFQSIAYKLSLQSAIHGGECHGVDLHMNVHDVVPQGRMGKLQSLDQ